MGLSNTLNTAVSGLTSHQKALDNIGNNLANVNTVGFKKGVYQFSTLLEQTLRGGMGSTGTTGSVNPIALGYGTQTGSISKVFTQGQIESTGSGSDMAIDGNGFFVVKYNDTVAYTRDGSFKLDENGVLSTDSGLYVQGTMAVRSSDGSLTIPQDAKLENITIPIGSIGGMAKTSTVSFSGNLNYTQNASRGLQLYGTTSVPSVDNQQSWMSGTQNTTDSSWTALEQESFFVWKEILDDNGMSVPAGAGVSVYSGDTAPSSFYYVLDGNTVKSVDDASLAGLTGNPASLEEIAQAGYVPDIREVSAINGGNVQTSQALGITVPDYVTSSNNSYTYPQWFYGANGASLDTFSYDDILAMDDASLEAALADIWPNGFQDSGSVPATLASQPHPGETHAATLDTPLEHLYVYENGKWSQMFSNLKEGDDITVSFDKGQSTLSATFIYNYPGSEAVGNQVALDYEKSYTLGHFLIFLGGDVNQTAAVCADISPDMFASVEDYNQALADLTLAKSAAETGTTTGAMGLVDVAAQISASNGGNDSLDAPLETAGAFTREGLSQVAYSQWDEASQAFVTVRADSFNVSLVSNLGTQNALSNISISHNNVTSKTTFSNETGYSSAQGNSTTTSVTFYDSLGNAHTATVRLSLVSEDSNFSTWRWYADCDDDTDFLWQADPNTGELTSSLNAGTGLFRFDADGNFVSGSDFSETGGIVINLENQGVDDTIHVSIQNGLSSKEKQDLDFSAFTYTAAATQVSMSSQNGSPPGSLDKFEVATDGTIYGVYSTGKTERLARLVIATVNVNGTKMKTNGLSLNLATSDITAKFVFNEGKTGSTTIAQVGYGEGSIFSKNTALTLSSWQDDGTGYSAMLNNACHTTKEQINKFMGGMQLQLGENSNDTDRSVISLKSMGIDNLGKISVTRAFDSSSAVIETKTLSLRDVFGGGIASLSDDAELAMDIIDQAINDVSTVRAQIGAVQTNMLQTNSNNLSVTIENLTKTESYIRDTDMASEMTSYTSSQILSQAGVSMLSQANSNAQNVLSLLR